MRLLILYFVLLGCSGGLFGQTTVHSTLEHLDSLPASSTTIDSHKTLLVSAKTDSVKIRILHSLSEHYEQLKHYDSARIAFKSAVNLKPKDRTRNALIKDDYLLSQLYKKEGNSTEEARILNTIISHPGTTKYTYRSYRNLAKLAAQKGDYYHGLEYLNRGLSNRTLCQNLDFELELRMQIIRMFANKYTSIFDAASNLDELQAVQNHEIWIEQHFEASNVRSSKRYSMYNNLAVVYGTFNLLDKALLYYKKAEAYYSKVGKTTYALQALMNIGIVYAQLDRLEASQRCMEQILQESDDSILRADVYDNMGYYLFPNAPDKKIKYLKKAIATALGTKDNLSETLPTYEEILASEHVQSILIYLIDLAYFQVKTSKDQNLKDRLKDARNTLYLIDDLVSHSRYQSRHEGSKLFWTEKGVDSYVLAVETCYLLNDIDGAFYFMEKNKALWFQEQLQTLQQKWQLKLPKALLEHDYQLYNAKQLALQALNKAPNVTSNQSAYANAAKRYNTFKDSLNTAYPEYTILHKETPTITFKEATLKHQAFIEYILNDTRGFGLMHYKGYSELFEIKDVMALQEAVTDLKQYFSRPLLSEAEKVHLKTQSYKVFQALFPSTDWLSKIPNGQLTIIPDHSLQTLAFEALTTAPELPLKESYLVHKLQINYLHSISAFDQIEQKQNRPSKKLLATLPQSFENTELPTLTSSIKLADTLLQYQSTEILSTPQATRAQFLKEMPEYEILHLNTHAGVTKGTPWIAFEDGKLNLDALMGYENQAELVVLDACETHLGKHLLGEGVINLSRGFFYNGAQSVIGTHWTSNEKSANTILSAFYKHLANGATKVEALQKAKQDYLTSHQLSETLPYYWAAYTLTGSIKPIELSHSSNAWALWSILVILTLLSIFIGIYKAYQKLTKS